MHTKEVELVQEFVSKLVEMFNTHPIATLAAVMSYTEAVRILEPDLPWAGMAEKSRLIGKKMVELGVLKK